MSIGALETEADLQRWLRDQLRIPDTFPAGGVPGGVITVQTIEGIRIMPATIDGSLIVKGTITGDLIKAGTIEAGAIKAGTITAAEIEAGSITGDRIKANTIEAGQIKAGTITATEIAAGTITGTLIAAGTIEAGNIKSGTITATQIKAATITTNEIAAGTIKAGNIEAHTITATQILAGTITSAEIAAATITGANVAAATITSSNITVAQLSALSADLGTITAGTVTGATLRTAAAGKRVVIDSEGLHAFNATEAVLDFDTTTGNLKLKGTIEAGSTIPASTVTGELTSAQIKEIAAAKVAGELSGSQIAANSITSAHIVANTIVAGDIAAGTITTTEIKAATIKGSNIAATTIEAGNIKANTITASQIASETITASQIAAATITGAKIAASTITAGKLSVSELSAITANLGTVTAGTITGATIKTSAGDTTIDANGIRIASGESSWNKIQFLKEVSGTAVTSMVLLNGGGEAEGYRQFEINTLSLNAGKIGRTLLASQCGGSIFSTLQLDAAPSEGSKLTVGVDGVLRTIINKKEESSFLQLTETAKRKMPAGRVKATGEKESGDGFTVEKLAAGSYEVTFSTECTIAPSVVATPVTGAIIPLWAVQEVTKTKFKLAIWNQGSGILTDTAFSFFTYG